MTLKQRLYEDYLKKSRFPDYEMILDEARKNGYLMMGILDFKNYISKHEKVIGGGRRILVNRHDIDTSARTALYFHDIEMSVYGQAGSASYYFRKKTIDISLIHKLMNNAYEPAFHYETIAEWEKSKKTKNREAIIGAFPDIKRNFILDLSNFRSMTSCPSKSVSSHGDFINRKYKIPNYAILRDDISLREECGIDVEAYDSIIEDHVSCRFADQQLLDSFSNSVISAIRGHEPIVSILTHPRNWKTDWIANTNDNIGRIVEGMTYRFG